MTEPAICTHSRMAAMEATDAWLAEGLRTGHERRRAVLFLDQTKIGIRIEPDWSDIREGESMPVYGEVHVPEDSPIPADAILECINRMAGHLVESHPNPRLN